MARAPDDNGPPALIDDPALEPDGVSDDEDGNGMPMLIDDPELEPDDVSDDEDDINTQLYLPDDDTLLPLRGDFNLSQALEQSAVGDGLDPAQLLQRKLDLVRTRFREEEKELLEQAETSGRGVSSLLQDRLATLRRHYALSSLPLHERLLELLDTQDANETDPVVQAEVETLRERTGNNIAQSRALVEAHQLAVQLWTELAAKHQDDASDAFASPAAAPGPSAPTSHNTPLGDQKEQPSEAELMQLRLDGQIVADQLAREVLHRAPADNQTGDVAVLPGTRGNRDSVVAYGADISDSDLRKVADANLEQRMAVLNIPVSIEPEPASAPVPAAAVAPVSAPVLAPRGASSATEVESLRQAVAAREKMTKALTNQLAEAHSKAEKLELEKQRANSDKDKAEQATRSAKLDLATAREDEQKRSVQLAVQLKLLAERDAQLQKASERQKLAEVQLERARAETRTAAQDRDALSVALGREQQKTREQAELVRQAQQELRATSDQLQEAQQRIATLEAALAAAEEKAAKLQQDNARLARELEESRAKTHALDLKLAAAQFSQDKVRTLESKLSESEKERRRIASEAVTAQAQQRAELEALAQARQQEAQKQQEEQRRAVVAKEAAHALALDAERAGAAEARAEVQQLRADQQRLQQELAAARSHGETHGRKLGEQDKFILAEQRKAAELQAKLDQVEDQLRRAREESGARAAAVTHTSEELRLAREQLRAQVAAASSAEKESALQRAQAQRAEERARSLASELEQLRGTLAAEQTRAAEAVLGQSGSDSAAAVAKAALESSAAELHVAQERLKLQQERLDSQAALADSHSATASELAAQQARVAQLQLQLQESQTAAAQSAESVEKLQEELRTPQSLLDQLLLLDGQQETQAAAQSFVDSLMSHENTRLFQLFAAAFDRLRLRHSATLDPRADVPKYLTDGTGFASDDAQLTEELERVRDEALQMPPRFLGALLQTLWQIWQQRRQQVDLQCLAQDGKSAEQCERAVREVWGDSVPEPFSEWQPRALRLNETPDGLSRFPTHADDMLVVVGDTNSSMKAGISQLLKRLSLLRASAHLNESADASSASSPVVGGAVFLVKQGVPATPEEEAEWRVLFASLPSFAVHVLNEGDKERLRHVALHACTVQADMAHHTRASHMSPDALSSHLGKVAHLQDGRSS